jgi:glucose-6-phosphate 1-dehydrogenase
MSETAHSTPASMHPIAEPLTLFLVGITGDLARKKVLKAIYQLFSQHLLPEDFKLVGIARRPFSPEEFKQYLHDTIQPDSDAGWSAFCDKTYYIAGDVTQRETFEKIAAFHDQLKTCGNHLWYLATLPSLYETVAEHLGALGLHHSPCGWSKLLIEKPFGMNLDTAQKLNQILRSLFAEEDLFRADHFLAKETAQNILAFRFANGIFEHLWNNQYVDSIQVNSIQDIGIEGRGQFYDATGTIRDVVQNHVLQMLALTLMDEPSGLSSTSVRQQRREVLAHLRVAQSSAGQPAVVRGQYEAGEVEGQAAHGYLEEEEVAEGSQTETAVAMKFELDTPRWRGVPIYVRAGKRLARNVTEISIRFKENPNRMFGEQTISKNANVLTFRIGPNEGVVVRLFVKRPGLKLELEEVPMQFCYKNQFQMELVEAYVKLIHDAVQGDLTLFPQGDEVEHSWQVLAQVLQSPPPVEKYAAGTWGPAGFDQLLEADGRAWIEPSIDVCQI